MHTGHCGGEQDAAAHAAKPALPGHQAQHKGGKATEDRLFTGALVLLVVMTTVAILVAEWLVRAYASGFEPRQAEVSVILARYLLVQILFVGMSGLISAMLNTRDKFGAPVWAPVLNNLVIIAVGATFLMVSGPGRTPDTVTDSELLLLGAGAFVMHVLEQYHMSTSKKLLE